MINFTATKDEHRIISLIAQRALPFFGGSAVTPTRLQITMDITACHSNGCPLRLQDLLDADDFNFLHDVTGIYHHINRKTGVLKRAVQLKC